MWRNQFDPYITVHPTQSSAILPLVLQLPSTKTSVHIAIYLPTSGKEAEFVSELANLHNCIEELNDIYDYPVLFIRGDCNVNPKNLPRVALLKSLIENYSLKQVKSDHPTYHHFIGEGKFDSNLDIILYSQLANVSETIYQVVCKLHHPEVYSHHDLLLSQFTLPREDKTITNPNNLEHAPRINIERSKIVWSKEGLDTYSELVSHQLQQLRLDGPNRPCRAATSVILQSTNRFSLSNHKPIQYDPALTRQRHANLSVRLFFIAIFYPFSNPPAPHAFLRRNS